MALNSLVELINKEFSGVLYDTLFINKSIVKLEVVKEKPVLESTYDSSGILNKRIFFSSKTDDSLELKFHTNGELAERNAYQYIDVLKYLNRSVERMARPYQTSIKMDSQILICDYLINVEILQLINNIRAP